VSFTLVTLVFAGLGLLEVRPMRDRLARLGRPELGRLLLEGSAALAAKLQRYMAVRTLVSALTGIAVAAVAALIGLELAAVWGIMAFALNYLPFVGPLVATVLATLLAVVQLQDLALALVVLAGLNLVQILLGSGLEPRPTGARLGLSPFLVLLAVFTGALLWGVPGAFLGVPVLIAVATFAAAHPEGRWIARLLGAEPEVR
jgi:AI-2 transport protein TqsA